MRNTESRNHEAGVLTYARLHHGRLYRRQLPLINPKIKHPYPFRFQKEGTDAFCVISALT